MALQAIVTKYFGPGNARGSRIKAQAAGGTVSMDYLHSMNLEDNHKAAAAKLCNKLGWDGEYIVGVLPCGAYAHVVKHKTY